MATAMLRDINGNPIEPQDLEAKVAHLFTWDVSKQNKMVRHWQRVLKDDLYALEVAAKIMGVHNDATKFFMTDVIAIYAKRWRDVVRAMLAAYEKQKADRESHIPTVSPVAQDDRVT